MNLKFKQLLAIELESKGLSYAAIASSIGDAPQKLHSRLYSANQIHAGAVKDFLDHGIDLVALARQSTDRTVVETIVKL